MVGWWRMEGIFSGLLEEISIVRKKAGKRWWDP
jgi:hypothetical protein